MKDKAEIRLPDGSKIFRCPICRAKHLTQEKHKDHVRKCFPEDNPPVKNHG